MKKMICILIVMSLLFGMGVYATDSSLIDSNTSWAKNYINRINKVGMVKGYPDGTFKPDSTMTRAEFITVLVRAMDYKHIETDGKWYQGFMDSALENDIITDNLMDIYKDPDKDISRIEATELFYNLIKKEIDVSNKFWEKPIFSDVVITESLIMTYSYGIFKGYPDGTFKPDNKILRSEVATIFSNLFFGKRDSEDKIIELPVFMTYYTYFTNETLDRIEDIKNAEPEEGNNIEIVLNESVFETTQSFDDFMSAYKNWKDMPVVDLRGHDPFLKSRLMGAYNMSIDGLIDNTPEGKYLLVYGSNELSKSHQNTLKDHYDYILYYRVDEDTFSKDSIHNQYFEGTAFGEELPFELSVVPYYLQERFKEVREEFGLTWTDEDFKNWCDNATEEDWNEVLIGDWHRTPFEIDFENKVVLVSEDRDLPYGVEPTFVNPQDYNDILTVKDVGYLLYEFYKMNIEYFLTDGHDWGAVEVYYLDDLAENGIHITIKDEVEGHGTGKSFHLYTYGNDASVIDQDIFMYYMTDQFDWEFAVENLEKNGTVIDDEYVLNNTRMNMYLFHGKEQGQAVYENYMKGYSFKRGGGQDPKNLFDGKVGDFYVNHMRPSMYLMVYTKELLVDEY